MSDAARQELTKRIDAVEEAYEFMLAYAAQGRDENDLEPDGGVREFLQKAVTALTGLDEAILSCLGKEDAAWRNFLKVVADDAERARITFELVLSQKRISSQLTDNLNASIQVRTILTDLFLVDEAIKSGD